VEYYCFSLETHQHFLVCALESLPLLYGLLVALEDTKCQKNIPVILLLVIVWVQQQFFYHQCFRHFRFPVHIAIWIITFRFSRFCIWWGITPAFVAMVTPISWGVAVLILVEWQVCPLRITFYHFYHYIILIHMTWIMMSAVIILMILNVYCYFWWHFTLFLLFIICFFLNHIWNLEQLSLHNF